MSAPATRSGAQPTRSLAELEAVVERGMQTFVEVGSALAEIRDRKLYEHETFEHYCRERWGFAASRARQLIGAAESVTTVTVAGLPAPANERQARELVSLADDEERLVEVWRDLRAEYGEDITAERIRNTVRNEQRWRRKREAAARLEPVAVAPPTGEYPVLLADPPWLYEHAMTPDRAVENHYPTMTLEELRALDVPAADDAVLFMWATTPKLAEAVDLMTAWGFTYRTGAVWVKDKIGLGNYFRQRHELLLLGRRGKLPVPEPANRPDSVIEAPRTEHSRKPEAAYELIERMYPGAAKIELFARRGRAAWAAWGNEAPEAVAA